jgi:hypothetical protein
MCPGESDGGCLGPPLASLAPQRPVYLHCAHGRAGSLEPAAVATPARHRSGSSSCWKGRFLSTVLLVSRPVLLLALGATVPGHLAAPTDAELPELFTVQGG